MSKKENKSTSKYYLNNKAFGLTIALSVVFFVLYVGSLILLSFDTIKAQTTLTHVFTIVRDVSIICLTIFGGTLISILVIEKRNKNAEHIDNMVKDVILCKEFAETLSVPNKKILAMKALGIDNESQMKVLNSVKDKLFEKNSEFYFSEMDVEACCNIKDSYIEKTIIKTVKLKSYAPTCRVKNFLLLQTTYKKIDGQPNLEVDYVSINGNQLLNKDLKFIETAVDKQENVLINNGYGTRFNCLYDKSMQLNDKKDTEIKIQYKTRVNKNDHQYTCRVSEHCKKFKLSFQIVGNDKYHIYGNGFGFMESADRSPIINGANRFCINFSDWIFREDGVSIFFIKQ